MKSISDSLTVFWEVIKAGISGVFQLAMAKSSSYPIVYQPSLALQQGSRKELSE